MKKLKLNIDSLKKNYTLLLVGVILILMFMVSHIFITQLISLGKDTYPKAVQGNIDYSNISFSSTNFSKLQGEVEFYWNKLLEPDDFKKESCELSPNYIEIPLEWNDFTVDGEKIGAFGYGTYRFNILVHSPGIYSLKISEFESAFRIWINAKDFGGAGKVGTTKKEMRPSWQRQEFDFYVPDNTIEVILQISNFQHRLGGASEFILFGKAESLRRFKNIRLSIETFLLGLLTILALYHLTLYHYRQKDKSILYFSLLTLFILLRLSTTGEKILLEFFPMIPWSIAVRIEYLSLPLIGMCLTIFFYHMLPKSIPLWFKRAIAAMALSVSAVILVFPTHIFTYTSLVILALSGFLIIGLFIFLFKAVLNKQQNSIGLFIGYILLCLSMINDIFFYLHIIQSAYILPFGLIFLLFIQSLIISKNTSLAFFKVEELRKELENRAIELEDIVSERTHELIKQNNEIQLQKNKIEDALMILDQTNKKLLDLNNFKKEMTNMMVHDLKNPLGNIIGLLQLPKMSENTRKLAINSGREMQELIQNILDVTKYEKTKMVIHDEHVLLYPLVESAYRQNEFMIYMNSIKFENLVPKDLKLTIDKDLIIRVFSNIISNATKYQNQNGIIRVSSELIKENENEYCKINLFNSGERIPEDKLEAIFDIYHQVYSGYGQHAYSTGIGLTFCKMAVEAHGGKIGATNEASGVTFWITLPIDTK
jgi:signal transduction histidine kinase